MGRFELGPRARLILGAGYQWPVSSFRIFDETWLATLRLSLVNLGADGAVAWPPQFQIRTDFETDMPVFCRA